MEGTLKVRILAGLLLAGLLIGCNDEGRDSAADTAAGSPGLSAESAADPETDSAGAAEPAGSAAGQVETEEAEDSGGAAESGDDILNRHWQETIIEFKNPITMSMELRKGEFNPAEGADMSILTFEASCRVGRKDWLYKDIVVDNLKATESARLELDICSVEMMPLLKTPVAAGRTSTGGTILRMYGGLKFVVYDPEGKVMGTFMVSNEGEIEEAEPGELYSWRISRTDDDMKPTEYLFYRTPGRGESIHYEFGIAYDHGTVARKQVDDPLGNQIIYLFPNGNVSIVPPNPPERREPGEFRRN